MATINLIGKVCGKAGEPAVALRNIKTKDGGDIKIASFSVNDRERCYFKNKDDNPGQFYRVEISGYGADWAAEQLKLGSWVAVTGQPVWRQYNGQKLLDVKSAKVVLAEDWKNTETEPF